MEKGEQRPWVAAGEEPLARGGQNCGQDGAVGRTGVRAGQGCGQVPWGLPTCTQSPQPRPPSPVLPAPSASREGL